MTSTQPPVLNVSDVAELERRTAASGTPLSQLMRDAGRAVAEAVRAIAPEPCDICVLAGSGNNGGDGWVAAEFLSQADYQVSVICPGKPEDIKAQPAHDAAAHALVNSNSITVMPLPTNSKVTETLNRARVVIDALLGTGFSGINVRPIIGGWIDCANNVRSTRGICIVSVDVPSGLSAQTGNAAKTCIHADVTVTMMVMKPGLQSTEGRIRCGDITVAAICDLAPYTDFITHTNL